MRVAWCVDICTLLSMVLRKLAGRPGTVCGSEPSRLKEILTRIAWHRSTVSWFLIVHSSKWVFWWVGKAVYLPYPLSQDPAKHSYLFTYCITAEVFEMYVIKYNKKKNYSLHWYKIAFLISLQKQSFRHIKSSFNQIRSNFIFSFLLYLCKHCYPNC